MKLRPIEKELLRALAKREMPQILSIIDEVRVKERDWTGIGLFVRLVDTDYAGRDPALTRTLGSSIRLMVEDLELPVDAIIYVDEGYVRLIELIANSPDNFPEHVEEFSVEVID